MRRSPILLACVLALCGIGCADEGPTAFIDFNMKMDSDCTVSPDGEAFIPIGLYDIAEAGSGNTDPKSVPCRNSYLLNLRVNSYLRANADMRLGRAEPNILQISSAEVKLMTLNKETLDFGDADLPNPFRVVTAASVPPTNGTDPSQVIATIEAIPYEYASSLGDFVNGKILIETRMFGVTTANVDIDMKPFTYAVDICDGCLTYCRNQDILMGMEGVLEEDLIGDECPAQNLSGMDGRVCIDPDC